MKRTGTFLAVMLLAIGTTARAGELDKEYVSKAGVSPATPSAIAPASPGSELDRESPTQAWFYGPRRGYFGFGFGFGYPGFGYGFGYPGFGFGGFGYPGFGYGGFGYPGFGFGGIGFGFGGYGGGFGYGRGFGGYGFHRGRW